ncbi:MAG TPA: TMEM175 family protein [Thermoanaerobaculia bacterium]|nr:TMEM175 family protein [Thermoanaerobaculia bacterium]
MLRDKLIERHSATARHEFRWRSREISRLEGLSDAVFGFAITLLIVALEVPRTSGELLETMQGFISFALTFAFLYMLWYRQFMFFRRYGLEDRTTAILNGALLFVVLFFVFPLKFLFSTLINRLLGGGKMVRLPNGTLERAILPEHVTPMMTIYGLGIAAVFAIFALLHLHAYHRRHELRLTELEKLDTLQALQAYTASAGIGLLTVLYANVAGAFRGKPYEDKAVIAATLVFFAAMAAILKRRLKRKRQRQQIVERLIAEGALPQGDPEE